MGRNDTQRVENVKVGYKCETCWKSRVKAKAKVKAKSAKTKIKDKDT